MNRVAGDGRAMAAFRFYFAAADVPPTFHFYCTWEVALDGGADAASSANPVTAGGLCYFRFTA
jgi:hypothetical protein